MTFEKGKSGNPEGRPKGIKDRRTLFAEMIESHKEKLLNTALEMAFNGNEQMLKIFLDRLLPAKPKDDIVNIKLLGNSQTEKSKHVIEELNNQNLTPSEAVNIMQTLVMQVKVFDADEVAKFIREGREFINTFKKS